MTILEELRNAAHPSDGKPPRELQIREDQIDPLEDELAGLSRDGIRPDIRVGSLTLFGIPVRILGHGQSSQQTIA